MSDKKNDTRNQITGNVSKEQTTVGFKKNQPSTVDPTKKERVPNEKVPNIGDPKKKPTDDDLNNKKSTTIIPEKQTPIKGATIVTDHQEKSKHDTVTNADVKTVNTHESDQKFNNGRF